MSIKELRSILACLVLLLAPDWPASPAATIEQSMKADVPAAPTNLTVSVVGRTVRLTWVGPVGGDPPSSYVIEAGSAPGLSNIANVDTGSAASTLTAAAVPPGTYYVRVRGRNAFGVGGSSNEAVVSVNGGPGPCLTPPGSPLGLTVATGASSLVLRWQAPATGCPPTTFVLEAGSETGLANLAAVNTGSTATEFRADRIANGTYYVRVRAANAIGVSAASNEVVVTIGSPGPLTPCPMTTALQTVPLVVYSEAGDPRNRYIPSGFFGDFADLTLTLDDRTAPSSGSTSIRIDYRPAGSQRFAGIFWQCPANNFGTVAGAGLNLSRARQVRFFARASAPAKAEFKVGGIGRGTPRAPFPDSLDATPTNPVVVDLTTEWKEFVIDVSSVDKTFVIGGFMFVTSTTQNPGGLTLFLDEIVWR
jgi:hypothetical protein